MAIEFTPAQAEAFDNAYDIARMCCSDACVEALQSIKAQMTVVHTNDADAPDPDPEDDQVETSNG